MTIEIVIVGLSHHIRKNKGECNAWIQTLAPGTEFTFEWEPENPYTPGIAFKGYLGLQLVGRASRDDCYKLLCLKDQEGLVTGRLLWGRDKELHVLVDVPEGIIVPQTPEEAHVAEMTEQSLFPQGLNLTLTPAESRLKHTIRLLQKEPSEELMKLWLSDMKRTLSYEILKPLQHQGAALAQFYPELAAEAIEWRKSLSRGSEAAYQAWQNLMSDLRQEAQQQGLYERWSSFFFGDNADSPTSDQLEATKQQIESWLAHLPHDIWRIYHNDMQKWAQMLQYQLPNRQKLYVICTHVLVLEWVNGLISNSIPKSIEAKNQGGRILIESESESESAHSPANSPDSPNSPDSLISPDTPNSVEALGSPDSPIALTDPDGLFDRRHSLQALYDGFVNARRLMTDDGDWGLLALALSEDEGVEAFCKAKPPIKRFCALLVRWGFVPAYAEKQIYNSMKRRIADYAKAGKASENTELSERYSRWNSRLNDFIDCLS